MNLQEIQEIVSNIDFDLHQSYTLRVGVDWVDPEGTPDGYQNGSLVPQPWLQIVDMDLPVEYRSGRKWRLTQHMTESEVVGTAFAAYKAWLEHEMMESFRYCGVSVFNPHVSIQARVEMASSRANYEYRS